jgi:pyrimidine deaminase RibD-like protein
MNENRHPGLKALIELLRNHCLIKPNELRLANAIAAQIEKISGRTSDTESLRTLFHDLRDLADVVIEREIGSDFDGVPLRYLEHAVELAESSNPEDDGLRPRVGALIVNQGVVVATASRNQDHPNGGHAEQLAIESCDEATKIYGSTVITTLEPCTRRGSRGRNPCAELLIKYRVKKVVIGLPDPNPAIRGSGDLILRKNGIAVSYFPSGLALRLWSLNSGFIEGQTHDEFQRVFILKRHS